MSTHQHPARARSRPRPDHRNLCRRGDARHGELRARAANAATRCAARYRSLADGGFPYFVAEDDGAVAGYAYAGPFRPRPAYRFIVEDSIYVAPEAKGRGIGRALLQG